MHCNNFFSLALVEHYSKPKRLTSTIAAFVLSECRFLGTQATANPSQRPDALGGFSAVLRNAQGQA